MRCDFDAWTSLHQSIHNHPVFCRDAGLDGAQLTEKRPQLDRPALHRVVPPYHQQELLILIRRHREVRYQHGLVSSAAWYAETREKPRYEPAVRIRKDPTASNGAGHHIKTVV